jgi:acyl-CoA reductase-like NAD-dependent aldehyde dehydrogenase
VPHPLTFYIDGEWTVGRSGHSGAVINPATGRDIGRVPFATNADLDQALAGAERGFQTWRAVLPTDRARVLRKISALLREQAEAVARVATLEANRLPYGLAAYAFTQSQAVTAPEGPFGGVKESGIGRESGIEGLLEHMNVKTITETHI